MQTCETGNFTINYTLTQRKQLTGSYLTRTVLFWANSNGPVELSWLEKGSLLQGNRNGMGFAGGSVVKNLPANAGGLGSIPGSGRSPGEEMATHSSILAWDMPWTEEPGGSLWGQKEQEWLSNSVHSTQEWAPEAVLQSFPSLDYHSWALPPSPGGTLSLWAVWKVWDSPVRALWASEPRKLTTGKARNCQTGQRLILRPEQIVQGEMYKQT